MIDVSVIIPCRDEEPFIARCLDSVLGNDFPTDRLEILVVDGRSRDHTREIARRYVEKFPFIRLLDNPGLISSSAQNIGIANARGRFLLMLDGHATLDTGYIEACLQCLERYKEADCVAGVMVTIPRERTVVGEAVALALSSPFGVGSSHFRVGTPTPRWVDTVYCGCYRREAFDKVGPYREDLPRGQDYELCRRLTAAGGKILLMPTMASRYFARSRLNAQLLKYYFWEGFWAVYPFKVVGTRYLTPWRLVPLGFVASLVVTAAASVSSSSLAGLPAVVLGPYLAASLGVSAFIAARRRRLRVGLVLPVIFAAIHVPYGLGSAYAFLARRRRGWPHGART